MPLDQRNHDLVEDALAATRYAADLARMHASPEERRLAELAARRKHLQVHHLNINAGMNHKQQADTHQRNYEALLGR